jgi:hypothetical protein
MRLELGLRLLVLRQLICRVKAVLATRAVQEMLVVLGPGGVVGLAGTPTPAAVVAVPVAPETPEVQVIRGQPRLV